MALFTAAEAKAFSYNGDTPLAERTDAELNEAAARIAERFTEICGVAFEPTEATATIDGSGRGALVLPHLRVTEVEEGTVGDDEVDVEDVSIYAAGIIYRDAGWTRGFNNVTITYTHGHAAVPRPIKRAALIVAVHEVVGSDVPSAATSHSDELGTYERFTPGAENSWYGLPEVDSVLAQYREKTLVLG